MSVARALSVLEKKSGKWRVIPLEHIRNNNRFGDQISKSRQ